MKRLPWLLVGSVVLLGLAQVGGSLTCGAQEDVLGTGTGLDPGFRVEARDGWWSDVVILSDGSGPTEILRALSPDALNWAFYRLPSYLAETGTRRVAAAGIEYQESPELEPEDLEDWEFASSLAFDVYDQPIHYTQWGGSYFMDPHSQAWAGAVLDGIQDALASADGVSQDNISVPPFIKGGGGFSPREKAEFRDFLLDRLGSEELASRGIDAASFDIAEYLRAHGYVNGNPEAVDDPVFRAFVAYQYVSNLQIWQRMLVEIGIETMDEKVIHGNQYGVWTQWNSNPYSVLLSQLHQIVEIEYVSYLDSMPPGPRDSLIYKLGLASGRMEKPVWVRGIVYDWQLGRSVLRPGHLRLIAASAYANGAVRTFEYAQGTPNGQVDLPEEAAASLLQYYGWVDDHRFLFERRRPVANVAIVYSIPTMMWRYFPSTGHFNNDQVASLSGVAEVLEREHVPYDVLIFGHPDVWSDGDLAEQYADYDLLILPDIDCLSEQQVAALEAFVTGGGKLLFTGELGTYDENLVRREPSRMATLLDHPSVARLFSTPGRSYYRTAVQGGQRADWDYHTIASQVASLLGEETFLETTAPDTISVNAYTTRRGLYCVHFLNLDYDVDRDTIEPAGPFSVRVRLPASIDATMDAVYCFNDDGSHRALAAEWDGRWLSVTIPGVAMHTALSVGDLDHAATVAVAACKAALANNPWAVGQSDIAEQVARMNEALDSGDWLGVFDACATLEEQVAGSSPSILFDFSHQQEAALTEEDARTIDAEHPEWYLLEELAGHVTHQLNERPISDEALRDINVLAIAMHRTPFSQDEVAAVERFVSAGGGLLVIGNGGVPDAVLSLTTPYGLQYLPYCALGAEEHLWDHISFDVFDIVEH
ncbi:MAG: hypothetical protein WBC63_08635, partial [Candidatus Bipolaricaulia bacterium]